MISLESCLKADDLDGALIGVVERAGAEPILCYDYRACVRILMERDEMECGEAMEFLSANTMNAWHGEGTPCFLHTPDPGSLSAIRDLLEDGHEVRLEEDCLMVMSNNPAKIAKSWDFDSPFLIPKYPWRAP